MAQRKTQTESFWQEQFKLSPADIEFLYSYFLDTPRPRSIDAICHTIIQKACQEEEIQIRAELQRGKIYQPHNAYNIGEQIVFPRFDYAIGEVMAVRRGVHPRYENFSVIEVAFPDEAYRMHFISDFSYDHSLNISESEKSIEAEGLLSAQDIYAKYGSAIKAAVSKRLAEHNEFVHFKNLWLIKDVLPSINQDYLLNIAEAAIDITQAPQATGTLLNDMEFPPDTESEVSEFALNFALSNDSRFMDVSSDTEVEWYLSRLAPPEISHTPRRLIAAVVPPVKASLPDELKRIIDELDDDATPPEDQENFKTRTTSMSLILNYPHRRVGTLPLTKKTRTFFPSSGTQPTMIKFVGSRTKEEFPGWIVPSGRFVFGLDQWFPKNEIPVGAYIKLERTDDPHRIVIDYEKRRPMREWIRTAAVEGNHLVFKMEKRLIPCEYDDLMIIGEADPISIDTLWVKSQEQHKPLFDHIIQIFPELSKLNPQSTVHAKTLYSALNVIRRTTPGEMIMELSDHECFIPMGNGYWTYDPSMKG